MLFRLFNTYRAYSLGFIALIALSVWIPHIAAGNTIYRSVHDGMPVYHLLFRILENRYLSGIAALILYFVAALYLNRLNTLHNFITERSYLPAFLFILLSGSLINPAIPGPAIVSLIFVLFAVNKVIRSFKNDSLSYLIFDASVLIAVGSLFYLPAVLFIAMLLLVLAFLRPFYWREWLYSVLGFSFVYFIVYSLYYLCNIPFGNYVASINENFSLPRNVSLSFFQIALYGITGFLLLAASARMIRIFPSLKIFSRKVFQLWLLFFLASISLFLVPSAGIEAICFVAAPLCYLFTNYFITMRTRWFRESLFLLLLGLLYAIHYIH